MWCVFSVCSQGARTTTCASGHTFQCVSAECVCSCEQTCVHMGVIMVCVHALMCLPGPCAHIIVPGGHQRNNLTHKMGLSSSQPCGQELG